MWPMNDNGVGANGEGLSFHTKDTARDTAIVLMHGTLVCGAASVSALVRVHVVNTRPGDNVDSIHPALICIHSQTVAFLARHRCLLRLVLFTKCVL